MSKFFINRPIFATVLSLLALLIGAVALVNLPVAQYPNITPPTIQVSATYPGADPELIATTIGAPIEEQINGVEGMMYMSSYSGSGSYNLTITFEIGTDIDMASVMVQNRISPVLNTLPSTVIQQGVTVTKQATDMLLIVNLFSRDSIYDALYLSNYATLNMQDELARVPGVGGVTAMGAGNYSMRIWLDPHVLQARGISVAEVQQAIQTQNIGSTAGDVGTQPGSGKIGFQYAVQTKGQLTDVDEFKNIIIRTGKDGQILRLKDIAEVDLGSITYNVVATDNLKQTAFIGINQTPDANAMQVATQVKAKLKQMEQYMPEGLYYEVTLDTTDYIVDSIKEVIKTFFITMAIVILVIMLFLQNWRAVLIPTITIPVSLIATFGIMLLLGFSINTLTLFGMILAIAIVVDDAIVVVENTYRILEGGNVTVKEAVIKAMDEITGPIITILLVMLAVFIPTAFIGGITGQLFRQFALTIAASTFISAMCSLTLTPSLCAIFLKPKKESKFFIYTWFNKAYAKFGNGYQNLAVYISKRILIAVVAFIALSGVAFYAFIKAPSTFIPEEDQGFFIISVQLPNAASLARTEEVTNKVTELVRSIDGVEDCISIAGYSFMGGGVESNGGSAWVVLKPWSERKAKSMSAESIVKEFNGRAYMEIEEAVVFAVIPPAIPGMGASGGLDLVLQDRNNYGSEAISQAIQEIQGNLKEAPSIENINSTYQSGIPQYMLRIDNDKLMMMGVTYQEVNRALSIYLGSSFVNNFPKFGRIYDVMLGGKSQSRQNIEDVLNLSVQNGNGQMVPFSAFATVDYETGMNQIYRYQLYNSASLICNVKPGYSSSQGISDMEHLITKLFGNKFGYEWTSMAYQEVNSSSSVTLIYILAIIVALLVVAAQYESWGSPIAVITGIPMALLGVLLGIYVMSLPISIYTQIGMVLLIALSAKNGILIVAFARDAHAEGKSIRDSSLEALRLRLRPIMMTSLAFVFGVLPLLFATGAGANSRISLGTAVVFGMALNTLLGTLFIPMFYEIMQTFDEKVLKNIPPIFLKKKDDGDTTNDQTPKNTI